MRRLLLALLVAWTAFAFLQQTNRAYLGWRARLELRPRAEVAAWRFGTRPVKRLARCAQLAREVLPPRSRVLLHTPRHDFMEWRWASYFLFEHDLLLNVPPGARHPDFVLAYDGPQAVPLTLLQRRGPCSVYRMR